MRRRTANSVAQTMPVTMPIGTCHTQTRPESGSAQSTARAPRHDKELGHQQSLAIERLADNSRDRTDEQHRQAARDSDDSNQKVECVAS
jgi:hypothetical protein